MSQEYRGELEVSSAMTMVVANVGSGLNVVCTMPTGTRCFVAGRNEDLVRAVENSIRTFTDHGNAVVNYAPANGRVTFHLNAPAPITTSASLAAALGFSALNSSINTQLQSGDRQPAFIWRPSRGLAAHPVDLDTLVAPRSTSRVVRSRDGKTYSIEGNEIHDAEQLSYVRLPKADVISTATDSDPYRPLQRFWSNVIHSGRTIAVYTDRTVNTALNCVWLPEVPAGGDSVELGSFAAQIGRSVSGWDSLYDVQFALVKKV